MIQLDGMQDDVIKLTLSRMLAKGHPDMGEMPILFFNKISLILKCIRNTIETQTSYI